MPLARPLNPTLFVLWVAAIWIMIDAALGAHWVVTLLITALTLNRLLWLHGRWRVRRAARAIDPSRPFSREDTPA